MATRMVGGFILVAFLFCILLAWPGPRFLATTAVRDLRDPLR